MTLPPSMLHVLHVVAGLQPHAPGLDLGALEAVPEVSPQLRRLSWQDVGDLFNPKLDRDELRTRVHAFAVELSTDQVQALRPAVKAFHRCASGDDDEDTVIYLQRDPERIAAVALTNAGLLSVASRHGSALAFRACPLAVAAIHTLDQPPARSGVAP